ncbi:MAG: PQQ-binding-like beta-propeller repeat protein [Planctomycetota bacterium]
MNFKWRVLLATLSFLVIATCGGKTSSADDWSGWMGDSRDGVYRESSVIDEIPDGGLSVKWRLPIAAGYAGPAVAGGKVFVFDYEKTSGAIVNDPGTRAELQGSERLLVLDAASGEELWRHRYERPYKISYPSGPRCTPTVDGELVFILGAEGDFRCLRIADGELIWKRQLVEDFGAEVPIWGFSAHPLVHGDLIYTMVGGEGQGIVAFDKLTGEVRWKALDVNAGYCAPTLIKAGGVDQLIVFHPEGVEGLDPLSGKTYWDVPLKPSYEMSVAIPVIEGDRMFVSSIHTEAVMIQLSRDTPGAKELWRGEPKNAVHCSNAAAMFVDGIVYGTDCLQGSLIAVDGASGERLWETFDATKPDEKRFIRHGTAFITRLGDSNRFLLFSETGDLIAAELSEKGFVEHGRMHIVDPTNESFGRPVVWSHPAYAERTAFIRNDKELVAVDLAK